MKLAILDAGEVKLFQRINHDWVDLEWPAGWPEYVTVRYLRGEGFHVVNA